MLGSSIFWELSKLSRLSLEFSKTFSREWQLYFHGNVKELRNYKCTYRINISLWSMNYFFFVCLNFFFVFLYSNFSHPQYVILRKFSPIIYLLDKKIHYNFIVLLNHLNRYQNMKRNFSFSCIIHVWKSFFKKIE